MSAQYQTSTKKGNRCSALLRKRSRKISVFGVTTSRSQPGNRSVRRRHRGVVLLWTPSTDNVGLDPLLDLVRLNGKEELLSSWVFVVSRLLESELES